MLDTTNHVLDYIDDYLHHVLSADDARRLEQHCETCRICQVALDEAAKRKAALLSLPAVEASDELINQTLRKLDRHTGVRTRARRIFLRTGLIAAAVSIAVIGTLHLYYLNLRPSPYDLHILGQTELLAGTDASLRVRLVNHDTGSALSNTPVEIALHRSMPNETFRLASFTTDAQGTGSPRFRLPDWTDGNYELRVTARPSGDEERIARTVKLKRSWKLMLSTDKPVYQPGQTIHMRSLALRRPDLKPLAGQEAVFTLTDPKGNILFKQREPTSRFGIASTDCPLAVEILEGPYTIECRIGDTTSRQAVEIKKYVLPKFKIALDLDRPYYAPDATVHGTIQADYFFGKPVADAQVTITVKSNNAELGGPHLSKGGRQQNESPPSSEPKAQAADRSELALSASEGLKKGERDPKKRPAPANVDVTTTDSTGAATFSFRLPATLVGREQDSGDARIIIEATVTDSAGQKQSRSISRIVTAKPLRIEVIPESGALVRDVPNTIYVYTTYADGRPARTRVSLTGQSDDLTTSELGVASFELIPRNDTTTLTLRANDDKGLTATRTVKLEHGQAAQALDFLVRTDKAVYSGGDTMHLTALAAGQQPVFIDLIKDGQTILTTSVPLQDGKGAYDFDIPPEVFGTLELVAYRFAEHGLPVRKSRTLYIHQARPLKIQAALDRAEYRPGAQAKLALSLTDETGKPACGAISLAAVDEAVFSVLDQAPGMESTFFSLEQELLKPVYEIHPWSPDENPQFSAKERTRFEQALFARTATSRGGLDNSTLQRLINEGYISPRTLERIDEPEFQEALNSLPPDSAARIRAAIWPASEGLLLGNSYPAKASQISRRQYDRLELIKGAWVIVGIAGGLLLLAILWLTFRAFGRVMLVLGCLVLLISSLLPSLARARECSKRTMALAQLSSVDSAMMLTEATMSARVPDKTFRQMEGLLQSDPSRPSVRVREWFPETLLWRPELITDDQGRATLDLELADSITSWRLTAGAVTVDGRLGAMQSPIRVFQPFFVDLNLPVSLTRGDEVAVPVVVYNYLDKPQTVELALDAADWFERLDESNRRIELAPGEVKSAGYRIRVLRPGQHQLTVTARGAGVADAIKRAIEVVPDGRRIEQTFSGTLDAPADLALDVPANAIEGSVVAILKIYPSTFSQLVEGLDAIFQMPYGCFEQTSSTTYPNVLALDYLQRTGKSVPEIEAKARQYIHLGYQRLVGFEVSGGGFDWFGRPPANQVLTAYGLMEFQDMARVHDVDPNLIDRTRRWLLAKRKPDGSWQPEGHMLHDDPTGRSTHSPDLGVTAYIAWSVFSDPNIQGQAAPTRNWLLNHEPQTIDDPYTLALVCNALIAIDSPGGRASRPPLENQASCPPSIVPYLDRLETMKRSSPDNKQTWWEQPATSRTAFYGAGQSGSVETTALAALAFIHSGRNPATARAALTWLAAQRDPRGTWYSTQATVLALKALLAGTGQPLAGEGNRLIQWTLDSDRPNELLIPAADAEVMKQIVLPLAAGGTSDRPAAHRVTLTDRSNTGAGYQLTLRYHVPTQTNPPPAPSSEPLAITVAYDRSDLRVGESLTATATVTNRMPTDAPMVILDLPVPAGFAPDADDLDTLQRADAIARYQINPRTITVYLRGLKPGAPFSLAYRLRATMPVKITVPPAQAYEYYDPAKRAASTPATLIVNPV